jgi:hypothetical protein
MASFFNIFSLPKEILLEIFLYLDPKSYKSVAETCPIFRDILKSDWARFINTRLYWYQIGVMTDHIIINCTNLKCIYPDDNERIDFLSNTAQVIHDYSRTKLFYKREENPETYNLLLKKFLLEIHNINKIIITVEKINSAFDIFDFTIRKYFDQITYLYPDNPDKILEFPDHVKIPAQKIWNEYFGENITYVSFDVFVDMFFKYFPNYLNNELFLVNLKFFVNFPDDNIMTIYKWFVFNQQFGPFEDLDINFFKNACTPGFLGLINIVEARDVLKNYPSAYIIRFSRKEPRLLTISLNMNGLIRHFRMDEDKTLLDLYNKQRLHRYYKLDININDRLLYSTSSSAYFINSFAPDHTPVSF